MSCFIFLMDRQQANMSMNAMATANEIIQHGMNTLVTPLNNGLVTVGPVPVPGTGATADSDEVIPLTGPGGNIGPGPNQQTVLTYTSVYEQMAGKPPEAVAAPPPPPPLAQPPTFYVMSPHPATAPPTPQHNPFSTISLPSPSPLMSPAPPGLTPIMAAPPPPTPPITIQQTPPTPHHLPELPPPPPESPHQVYHP